MQKEPQVHPTDRLIIFTRYPQPGKAKTRLIPALGAAGAAALQRQMTEYTLNQAKALVDSWSVSIEIWFADGNSPASGLSDRQLVQDWLGSDWIYHSQATGDLGARMAAAFQTAFSTGAERVVTIGTDCPQLDADRIRQAFEMLHQHDLVLGPATDGGYYLIGLRQFIPELFVGVAWGTATVLQQTVEIAASSGLTTAYLKPLTDVDRAEDLWVWEEVVKLTSDPIIETPQLSVIIPVLNEASTIQTVLARLQPAQAEAIEIIVVDGGSQDETVALAKQQETDQLVSKIISSPPGRARQMNAGARVATGEVLLFLHADTQLPDGFVQLVQQTLARPNTIAGAFELQIAEKIPGIRLVEWGVKWRSRLLQMPYGDQAIFLRAKTFHQLGGFAELPIMEDFDFVCRLRTQGKVAIVPAAVITSGRRWQKLGVLKTTLINQILILAYFLKVSPERLARWYRGN